MDSRRKVTIIMLCIIALLCIAVSISVSLFIACDGGSNGVGTEIDNTTKPGVDGEGENNNGGDNGDEPENPDNPDEPRHKHTFVATIGKEATCTQAGNIAYWYCADCGKYFSDSEGATEIDYNSTVIKAKGHVEVVDGGMEATCTEDGLTEGKHCSACNEVLEAQQAISAKGHTEVTDDGKEPTCTEDGLTAGKHCSECSEILEAQQAIPAKGHTEVIDGGKQATCTEDGLTDGKHCSVCNDILVAQEVIKAGHKEEFIEAKPATCEEDGMTGGTICSVCGKKLAEPQAIPALGHDYGEYEITKPATCTENGSQTRNCSRCDKTQTEEINAKGHTEVADVGKEPTCTEDGLTEGKHCSACGTVTVEQQTIKGGHLFGELVEDAAPTCTAAGSKSKHCSRCGEKSEVTGIPALGHDFGDWQMDNSNHWKVCSRCNTEEQAKHTFTNQICDKCKYQKTGSEGLKYVLSGDNYIVSDLGECTDTEIIIPAYHEGKPVTGIGEKAFNNYSHITSITLPDGLTQIGTHAFADCAGLESLIIPDSVTSIGRNAFIRCTSLKSIVIPDGVQTISAYMFTDCNALTSITLSSNIASIENAAFRNCKALTDINFKGTKEQWNAISKGSTWNSGTGAYTVHCTDGDLAK